MDETPTRSPVEHANSDGMRGILPGRAAADADGGAPVRCLIVDDSEIYAEAVAGMLARQDIVITGIASTSAEAIRHVGVLAPDVALVDVALGEESGFALARLLNAVPRPITVILMSAYLAEEFADAIKDDPATSYLHKSSISGAEIRGILRRHRAARGR